MTSPPQPQPCVPPIGNNGTISGVSAIQLEKRSPSPSRPALVASLEARRMSLPANNVAAASRISDMGPPPTTTSPSSSPGSAGSSPERDASDISRMLNASGLHQFAHSEGPVSLTITISREGERSHTNISVTPSVDARKTPHLLLTALEEAKEYILGRCQDPASSASACRGDSSAASSPGSARGGSPGTKREAEADDSPPQKRSRTASRSNGGEPITAYRKSVPGMMSSQEYLQYLLRGLAAKGYGSMSPEERESLFMSTLSSNYHAFTRHISKAYHAIQQLRHKATIYLGQRDEALSRLALLQQRLIGQQTRGRARAPAKVAAVKGDDIKWWPGRSLSAPSVDVSTLRTSAGQGNGAAASPTALPSVPECNPGSNASCEQGRQRMKSVSATMSSISSKGIKASSPVTRRGTQKPNGQPPASLTTVTLHPLSNAFSAESDAVPASASSSPESQSEAGSAECANASGDGAAGWTQTQTSLAQASASLMEPAPIFQYNNAKPEQPVIQSPGSGAEPSDSETTPRATPQAILPSCAPVPFMGVNGSVSPPQAQAYNETNKASKNAGSEAGLLSPFVPQDERGSATATLGQGEWAHHQQNQQQQQQQNQQNQATNQFLNYVGVDYPLCGGLATQQHKAQDTVTVPLDQWRQLTSSTSTNGAASYSTVPMGAQNIIFREVKNTTPTLPAAAPAKDVEKTPRTGASGTGTASLLPSPEITLGGSGEYDQWSRASLHTGIPAPCQDQSLQRAGPPRPPQPQHQVQAPPPHPPPHYDNNTGAARSAAGNNPHPHPNLNVFAATAASVSPGQSVKLES